MELNFLQEMEGYVIQKKFFFPLLEAISVGCGKRFPITHSTSIMNVLITPQSDRHWPVSEQRSLSPTATYSEGIIALSDLARWTSKYIAVNSSLRTYVPVAGHRSTGAILTSLNCHWCSSKNFLWWCGASLSLCFGHIFRL